ncbi:MAG: carboxypeptidase regulatory-like domain-containing protein [Acidobacteriota bacterium]
MSPIRTRKLRRSGSALRWLPFAAIVAAFIAASCGGQAPGPPEEEELPTEDVVSPGTSPAPPVPVSAPPGALSGRLSFAGAPPGPQRVEVTKDQQVCGAHPIVREDLLVGADGGLRNVVVSLVGVPATGAAGLPATELRQKGCVFVPHVVLMPAGEVLAIYNDDGILHNIHTFSTLNRPVNRAQPKFKKRIEIQFERPETIRVTCDAHPWMQSWLVVSDHPYVAVSDAGGAFRIENVPPGTYETRLWHETLGERTRQVQVRSGQTTELNVEFSRPS